MAKRPLYGGIEFGGAFLLRHLKLAFTYVIWTKEFKGQPGNSHFGAFSLSFGV